MPKGSGRLPASLRALAKLDYWSRYQWTLRQAPELKHFRIPTSSPWFESNVNGAVYYGPTCMFLNTSVNANSRALAQFFMIGSNSGDILYDYIDWTKHIELSFFINRYLSDAEVVARVQLKEVNTEGQLAARGIGIQINNFDVFGEAYGTAGNTVAIGTMIDNQIMRVKIIVESNQVEFWVNGVLAGTLTGTAVPNVAADTSGFIVMSIINGVTGGVNAYLYIGNIEFLQEW